MATFAGTTAISAREQMPAETTFAITMMSIGADWGHMDLIIKDVE
jgi:hypothetical protein